MKPLKSKNPDKHLLNTISYFSFFGYPPSFSEIHTFFPEKIAKSKLKILLERLVRNKSLICHCEDPEYQSKWTKQSQEIMGLPRRYAPRNDVRSGNEFFNLFFFNGLNDSLVYQNNLNREPLTFNPALPAGRFQPSTSSLYTLPQYTTHLKNRASRQAICQKKFIPVKYYTGILEKLPFVRFIGITGSASMENTTPSDDVDIFIITRKNCLFIGRFFAILLAHIFHVRSGKDTVCLNLFFDEKDLVIPPQKQTPYVAHEVLQMKPVVNKGQVYERFLKANEWIYEIYPNSKVKGQRSKMKVKSQKLYSNVISYVLHATWPIEFVLKTFQLAIIRRNKTGLIISPTQLWLFRKDFEKKIHVIARKPTFVG